jgi:predicted phage baseplate assembly protein
MPLPLPNLDTRRWADLAAEGRSQIPLHAPAWTDHNASDPGITFIELFAWLVEADIFRSNRVLPRHREAFLRLLDFAPDPPRAARVMLDVAAHPGQPVVRLPAGLQWRARAGGGALPFRTLAELHVVGASIAAVQVAGRGADLVDVTRAWRSGFAFTPWGDDPAVQADDPDSQPALYVGFDAQVPAGVPLSLGFAFDGEHAGIDERVRIAAEASVSPSALPAHHAVRTCWDCFDGSTWRVLDAAAINDDTRGFTLDGTVVVSLPVATAAATLGAVQAPLHYLRCRLVAGPPDAAPAILALTSNACGAQQVRALEGTFTIRRAVRPADGQEPQPGLRGRLAMTLDAAGAITRLSFTADGDGIVATVLDYRRATASAEGSLTVDVALLGRGSGLPGQTLTLPHAPAAAGVARLWTIEGESTREWTPRPDLAASRRTDADFVLDAASGRITFGDGERGAVVPAVAAVLAACDTTAAGDGNVPAGAVWEWSTADAAWNHAVLGGDPTAVAGSLGEVANRRAAAGGADAEDPETAAGRAAESLWAHERLLGLASVDAPATLDCQPREQVLGAAPPQRASTLADHERLALGVPGTQVARARAWALLDPALPGVSAPGTVTVVVVPWLPRGRPQAGPGLLAAVRRHLDRRRLVGTRLRVVGPQYREVTVRASVALRDGARSERVHEQVLASLQRFLDPLQGGPDGRGWPFGRDVYRSEILELIDRTSGVDYVVELSLQGDTGEPLCGNLCVGPLQLVVSGMHEVVIVGAGGASYGSA